MPCITPWGVQYYYPRLIDERTEDKGARAASVATGHTPGRCVSRQKRPPLMPVHPDWGCPAVGTPSGPASGASRKEVSVPPPHSPGRRRYPQDSRHCDDAHGPVTRREWGTRHRLQHVTVAFLRSQSHRAVGPGFHAARAQRRHRLASWPASAL